MPAIISRFDANGWRLAGAREMTMATAIDSIAFNFGSQVSFTTSRQNRVGQLLGCKHVPGFALSFRGAFAAGTMTLSSQR